MLSFAVMRVAAAPGTMRSRVLGKLLVALSLDGRIAFGPNDIYALDGETIGLAAELIEGRWAGWWRQEEWDDARGVVEAIDQGLTQQHISG